jgi:ligand-binding sensor domain-containing protein/tRNA A-37 threonylcarbamoyl transferase component Bud32
MEKRVLKTMRGLLLMIVCAAVMSTLLAPLNLFAQKKIDFEQLGIADGLSQNTVYAILQDSRGFLWFGTEDGLNRFDGYTFKVYKHNSDEPGSLSNNRVQAIYEDSSGALWIGTHGGGLNKFDRYNEIFTHFMHEPSNPNSLNNNSVWIICGEEPGILWVGTESGITRFDSKTGIFTRRFHGSLEIDGITKSPVRAMGLEGPGILWIGTLDDGLYKLTAGKTIHYVNEPGNPNSLSNNRIEAIYIDPSGVPWIGTRDGLNKFDGSSGTFINFNKKYSREFGQGSYIRFLAGLRLEVNGKESTLLAVGTYGEGLYFLNEKTGPIINSRSKPGSPAGLSSNYIQYIYEDDSGIVWVGTDSGLNKFDKKKQRFAHWAMEPDNPDSLCNNSIWAIYKDRSGILWIGTEGGLERLDRGNNKCTRFTFGGSSINLANDRIMSILEDRNENLWIGTFINGLYCFDRKKKRFAHLQSNPSIPRSFINDHINTIYEDRSGNIWVGSPAGLNRYDPRTEIFTCHENLPGKKGCLSHNYVNVIYEDHAGALWIGTKGGLNLYQPESGTFTHWKADPNDPKSLTNDNVSSIHEDRPGIFWIGTWGGGLNRFDRESGTFKHYLEKDGLPNEIIYSILSDEDGNLWLSTNKGIAKFDLEKETFKNYDVGDGLQSNEFNSGAYYKSEDGEMFFGGINGFNAFYPRKITDNPHIPPIVITDFQVFGEPVTIGAKSLLKESVIETEEIRLPPGITVFSFDFTALDFSNPKKNKYAYKMEKFDKDWNYRDSSRRYVTYTNLNPGKYVFRVKGSNNDGAWNEQGRAIKIIIIPPISKTWWFRLLMAIAFAGVSYVVISFVKRYITLFGFWKKEKYIGKFRLLERIGSGGMGTIYKAEDTIEKSGLVALKVLREELFPDENHRRRFKMEAAIIDQLDHPNIVKVIERGQHQEKLFIVMEYLEGKTLAKKIAEDDKIEMTEVLDIMFQITCALKKIHSKNIVHRDLKPENIMLIEKDGKKNIVKLLDFGLARTEHQTKITQAGTVLGTLNYMAPEQISHSDYSLATDIYSLGVIFYETATGRIPFPGGKMTQIMGKILSDTPTEPIVLRTDLAPKSNALIMQMMEKDRIIRPSVEAVLQNLEEIIAEQTRQVSICENGNLNFA